MKTQKILSIAILSLSLLAGTASVAQTTKTVGGAEMSSSKFIADNIVNSQDHTTLVSAITQAGLLKTLGGRGPFTVFAPTNAAFAKLPKGTMEKLLQAEPVSRATLQQALAYHVVPGKWDADAIKAAIKKGNGVAEITTVRGAKLWFTIEEKQLVVKDEQGGKAKITIADAYQKNGVLHVVDTFLRHK